MQAALFMVTAMTCFTIMAALVRFTGREIPALEIAFFRNLFALPFFLVTMLRHGWSALRPVNFGLHVLRALNGVLVMAATFSALTLIPLAQATSLGFASPLFATVAAMLLLGERIRIHRTSALIIGAVGVIVILQPGSQPITLGAGLALAGALGVGIAAVLIKKLTATDSAVAIAFWMVALQTPLSFPAALYVWVTPSIETLGLCFLLALFGTIGHVAWGRASSLADVTQLQPFEFLKLPLAALFGYLAFSEGIDLATWLGGLLIFAGAGWSTHREAVLARERRQPQVSPSAGAISGEMHQRPAPVEDAEENGVRPAGDTGR